MKSILVTGGAGFIGSHTCLLLLEKGYEIFVIDSLINSSFQTIKKVISILEKIDKDVHTKIHLIKGDIKNHSDIENVFQMSNKLNKSIEAVIHFAGLKSVSDSILDPITYWENNVSGTINLCKIMEKYNCKNILFSSSATVYKAKLNNLLSEDDTCEPKNPYGYTKLTVERILNDIFNRTLTQWRIVCLRYFNPVGAHKSGLIGENPLGKANNIYPQITRVAMGEQSKIKIFGSDWPTIDGTGVRDYIHVMDLAEGHIAALNFLLKNKPQFKAINLGTGVGTSVLEFIRTFEKVNNVEVPFCFKDRRQGDSAFLVADNSLAKYLLNWIPKRNIEDICKDGWNWQKNNSH
ncbi:UDP-glucose 4-epimerase GalE [Prochlorococcus sp. AH-736-A21]|nr:UDP-glucose 4-epimerase GalE [Prochlorococcus sp. AH-736-A21]